jgi:deferrochelatase/peroxidase EfeB
MTIETWDRDILDDQEQVIGRHKLSGALNEYITHIAGALFAISPGISRPGDWWGRTLLTT